MLTKTNFNHFIECPIWLWLLTHRPNLIPPDTEETKRRFAQGNIVDNFARRLFPGGVEVSEFNQRGFEKTLKIMAGPAKVLYQPTAVTDTLTCRADIFVRNREKWDLYEVKQSNSVKKPAHYFDVGFQRVCFENAGIEIGRTFLVHLNGKYVRHGEIEPKKLFIVEDITDEVNKKLAETKEKIAEALEIVKLATAPNPHLIELCVKKKCDYIKYYCEGIGGVSAIASEIKPKALLSLLKRNILKPELLSAELLKSIGFKSEVPFTKINAPAIRTELKKLKYPLYFFDYETYGEAIPPFDGTKPHQQIPFQYSLHMKDSPTAEIRHTEFLMKTFANPVPDLLAQLKCDIGPRGSVIIWFAKFESDRNKEMAKMMPEYGDFLKMVNERIFDLYLIFKFKNQMYIKSEFGGNASLKTVLPILCPELSYDSLEIHEGGTASNSWPKLFDEKLSKAEREKIYNDMIAYCRLDTLAMVEILKKLRADLEK